MQGIQADPPSRAFVMCGGKVKQEAGFDSIILCLSFITITPKTHR